MTDPDIIDSAQVPGWPKVFVVGSFDTRITFYSQQVRGLELIDALIAEQGLAGCRRFAVVGGGAAGLAVAAALSLTQPMNSTIDVFESGSRTLTLQRNCNLRNLHPHLYDWPRNGATRPRAGLPILDWVSASANQVARIVDQHFHAISHARENVKLHTQTTVSSVEPAGSGYRVSYHPNPDVSLISSGTYDAIFLTIGFGRERRMAGVHWRNSYWSDGGVPQDSKTGGIWRVLVSGQGDGGLIDLMAAALETFDHGQLLEMITTWSGREDLVRELLAIENEAQLTGESYDLYAAYERRLAPLVREMGMINEVRQQLHSRLKLVFYTSEGQRFKLQSAIINRFLVFLLFQAVKEDAVPRIRHMTGPLVLIPTAEDAEAVYRFKIGSEELDFDSIYIRHGNDVDAVFMKFQEIAQAYRPAHEAWLQKNLRGELQPHLGDRAQRRYRQALADSQIPSQDEILAPRTTAPGSAAEEVTNVILQSSGVVGLQRDDEFPALWALLEAGRSSEALQRARETLAQSTGLRPAQIHTLHRVIASAYLHFGRNAAAGAELVAALSWRPGDVKALENAAFGYLLLNLPAKAQEHAEQAIALQSNSVRAHAVLLQLLPIDDLPYEVVALNPALLEESEVLIAIGANYQQHDDNAAAVTWFRRALARGGAIGSNLRSALGTSLVAMVAAQPSVRFRRELDSEQRADLEEAKTLLRAAWNAIVEREIQMESVWMLLNLSSVHGLLGESEEARSVLADAIEIVPGDQVVLRHAAILYAEFGDYNDALAALEGLESHIDPQLMRLKADLLRQTQPDASLSLAEQLMACGPEWAEAGAQLVALARERVNSLDDAINWAAEVCADHPEYRILRLELAKLLHAAGQQDETGRMLKALVEEGHWKDHALLGTEIANLLYIIHSFEMAARVYEVFVEPRLAGTLEVRYAACLYNLAHQTKLLAFCRSVEEVIGPAKHFTEMEVLTLLQAGAYQDAAEASARYCERYPDDMKMRIQLSLALAKLRNLEGLDEVLALGLDVDEFDQVAVNAIVFVYRVAGRHTELLRFLYRLRQRFTTNMEVHALYFQVVAELPETLDELLPPEVAGRDVVVKLEVDGAAGQWIVIGEAADCTFRDECIDPTHPLALSLTGKRIGDQVIIRPGTSAEVVGRITAMMNRYAYAAYRSRELVTSPVSPLDSIREISVGPDDFTQLEAELREQNHRVAELETAYRHQQLTVGMLARARGRSALAMWQHVTTSPDLGVHALKREMVTEALTAQAAVTDEPPQVWDPLTVLTASELGVRDDLVRAYGRPHVAQSLLDLLEHERDRYATGPHRNASTVLLIGGQLAMHTPTEEEGQSYISALDNLINWLGENCQVLPVLQDFPSSQQDLHIHRDWLGKAFYDSILLARSRGMLLIADEWLLRAYACEQHQVRCAWLQVLLINASANGLMPRSTYHTAVLRLIEKGYTWTYIARSDVQYWGNSSFWTSNGAFGTVLRRIGNRATPVEIAAYLATQILVGAGCDAPLPIAEKVVYQVREVLRRRQEPVDLGLAVMKSALQLLLIGQARSLEFCNLLEGILLSSQRGTRQAPSFLPRRKRS